MATEVKPVPATKVPPYPEMIIAAIESLNDPNGSNQSSIHKQIELKYGTLPPTASTLFVYYLNKMKSAGQLVFYKNKYSKPDPNAPARRGRGRPPKPRDPNASEQDDDAPKRGRGRPPKERDPNAPVPVVASGKKRGRPAREDMWGLKKPAKENTGDVEKPAKESTGEVKKPAKQSTGKVEKPTKESTGDTPRGRGRPKKSHARGRPKKVK